MQLINTLLFAGLATANGLHGRHSHNRRQYGYGGGYGAPVSNSSSVVSSSTELSPASSSPVSSVVVETTPSSPAGYPTSSLAGTGVYTSSSASSSSIGGTAVYPSSSLAGTGVSSSAGVYPSSSLAGTGVSSAGVYPSSSLAGTGVSSSAGVYPSSSLAGTGVYPSGTGAYPSIPLTTGGASEVYPVSSGSPGETYISTYVTDVTLTYTIGYGSSAHAVTTTIKETSTTTLVKTVYLTKPAGGYDTTVVSEAATPTSTTTISSTSTTTKYITVYPTGPVSGESPVSTGVPGEGGCAAPVYVTVTAQETVTVTAGGYESESATAAAETSSPAGYPVESSQAPASTAAPLYPTAPYGNGTVPSSVYAPSSGFFTYTKPAGTGAYPSSSVGGTAVYPVSSPAGTAVYPSFSLIATGVYPSSTVAAVESPSASPSGGYGGYGY